jgi:DegV family protein with EDD domain
MPTSSQPSVGDFLETYRELARQAEGIVSIHVSAAMTGTYNAALLAAQMVPEVPIRVIDSQAATMAQGFLVLEAARAAERGASLDEIVARVEALRPPSASSRSWRR